MTVLKSNFLQEGLNLLVFASHLLRNNSDGVDQLNYLSLFLLEVLCSGLDPTSLSFDSIVDLCSDC